MPERSQGYRFNDDLRYATRARRCGGEKARDEGEMMTPKDTAYNLLRKWHPHYPHDLCEYCLLEAKVADAIRAAINDKLEEAAARIEGIERRGVHGIAAEMVRAMKVK